MQLVDVANYPLLLDASWYQGMIDPQQIIAAGAHGVILKASELLRVAGPIDPQFAWNKAACEDAGLVVAAYGFLDPADGVPQADLLLQVAGANIVLALDLESAGDTLKEAEDFVTELHRVTGRWPLVYTADYVLNRIGGHSSAVLGQCPLWLCAIGRTPIVPKPWTNWTVHQYGYINLGNKTFDADRFNGAMDEMRSFFTVSEMTTQVRVIAPTQVTAYKQPVLKSDIAGYYKVGDTIQVFPQTVEDKENPGTFFYGSPENWYVLVEDVQTADNTNPAPPPAPAPTATVMYVDPGDVVNVRQSPSTTAVIVEKISAGTKVEVYLPADNSLYKWVKTKSVNGVALTAYISSVYLTTKAPTTNPQ